VTEALPHITTLIANHNHGALVGLAIASVLAQDYPADRRDVVVVDDGSSDDSMARLAAYSGRDDVQLISQVNRGQSAAYAAALAAARGDWVCLLDADDRFLPHKLRLLAQALQRAGVTPDNGFLCHDTQILDGAQGQAIDATWFDVAGLHALVPRLHVSAVQHFFPFSVTCGQVFGRPLLKQVVDRVPLWDWPMGADGLFGHVAMLLCGEVQLLPLVLSSYIVHGNNDFAAIEDGRFRHKPVWHSRWPKKLRLLERIVDSLDLPPTDRADRLGYIGRVEHAVRAVPSGRPLPLPCLSFVIDASGAAPAAVLATQQALAGQTHERCEHLWLGLPREVPNGGLDVAVPADAGPYARHRAGVRAANGQYLCLLRAGDRPDRRFAERHLHSHRHGVMTMISACDLRLLDADGQLLQLGVQAQAGGWSSAPAHVPAFASALRDWPLAPLPALVLRRTAFVDAFFAPEDFTGPERLAPWLLVQLLLQLGGATRLMENLVDLQLTESCVANPFWFAMPCDHEGPLPTPDLAWAADQLFAAYGRARREAHASYPQAWELRFLRWLLHSGGPALLPRLSQRLQAADDTDWADRMQQLLATARQG